MNYIRCLTGIWLAVASVPMRQAGRIVAAAVAIAAGLNADRRHEILDLDITVSEAETAWTAFLRKLLRRGLQGAKLVMSGAHVGFKTVIAQDARRNLAALRRPLHEERRGAC